MASSSIVLDDQAEAPNDELWTKYVDMVESDFPDEKNKLGTKSKTIPEEFIQELVKDLWEDTPLPTQWKAWIPAALILVQIAINLLSLTYAFITKALVPWRSLVFNTTFKETFETLAKTGSLPPEVQTDLHIFLVTNIEFGVAWLMVTYTVFQLVLLLADKSGLMGRDKEYQDKKNGHKKDFKHHKYETITETENEKYFMDPDSKDLDEKSAEHGDKKHRDKKHRDKKHRDRNIKDPDQNSSKSYAKRVYRILRQMRAIGGFSLLKLMKLISFQTLNQVFQASGKVFLPLDAKPEFPTASASFVQLQIKTFASLRTFLELRGEYAKKHENQKSALVQILLVLWGLLLVLLWIISFILFVILPLILCIMGLFSKVSQAATPPQPDEPAISPTNIDTSLRRRDGWLATGLSLLALLPLPATLTQNYSTVLYLLGFVNQFMSVVQGAQRIDFFKAHELEDEMVFTEIVEKRGTLGAVVWDMNTGYEDSKKEFWRKTKGMRRRGPGVHTGSRYQGSEMAIPVEEVMIPIGEEEEPFVLK
ncbi:hypothetical protein BC937DRAFT_86786 [Endogone sp. FLAS-F59071]|nr:hypothetical protein BC937DRAFT_86786 [Endogone sp. FLAS-F59071]|eukprot:RUS19881.1 hypothetical protein BC937DRAFT_86786 [Endogone sp. FLAS-F59071]